MKIRKCPSCKEYTFKQACPNCNIESVNPNPPRFSPEDKYGKYRRQMK